MEKIIKQSKTPIIGLVITFSLMLAFPLLIVVSQNQQDIRQKAASPQPTTNALPPGQNNPISGYVYLDKNTDGQRQLEETGVNNVQLKITQENLITFISTDENGYFEYQSPNTSPTSKTITVELILPENHKTINTNPNILSIQNNTKDILEFGIYPLNLK